MANEKNQPQYLSPEKFGALWKYVEDENVTNIDWDAGALWIKRVNNIRERVYEPNLTDRHMIDFSMHVGNEGHTNFSEQNKSVVAETDQLRIVCLHHTFSVSGVTVCLRKSLPKLRFDAKTALRQGYCDEKVMHLLINCVLAHKNFVFCGEPGRGKTEAAKFFSSYIPAHNKVITVEDVREWHYKQINPGKSCVEIKINANDPEAFHKEMEMALNLAVRLNPSWIMCAEARGREARFLLEAWSNGVPNMSTIHTKSVLDIPDRIINMIGIEHNDISITNQIYENVGVGVQLEEMELGKGRTRHFIKEVGIFYRKNGVNGVALIVEQGIFYEDRVPQFLLTELAEKLGHNHPYVCEHTYTNSAVVVGKNTVRGG